MLQKKKIDVIEPGEDAWVLSKSSFEEVILLLNPGVLE